jgi:putative transposase
MGRPGTEWHYSLSRSVPGNNGYIESFKGKLRDELSNGEIFIKLFEAKVLIEDWCQHYSQIRPHNALGCRTPAPEAIMPQHKILAR